jgi:hypothetical protein
MIKAKWSATKGTDEYLSKGHKRSTTIAGIAGMSGISGISGIFSRTNELSGEKQGDAPPPPGERKKQYYTHHLPVLRTAPDT